MASYYLAPDPLQSTQLIPGGNTPASACLLFTYVAGSSTKQTVYKDSLGAASHTNPIVLDSGGNIPNNGSIWIPTGVTIDAVLAQANDIDPPSSPYWTKEDISGINDVNAAASDWVTGPSPTFVSATQFVLSGDQSANFKNGRRIRTTNTGGTIYGRITSVIASAGSTTVNTVSDSGTLDSGLSATAYGLLDPQHVSINEYHVNKDGGSVASAGNGTTNIWGTAGNSLHVTGTNTIFGFSSAAYPGAQRTVIFDGALSLASSAALLSLPAPVGTNILTRAGDRAQVVASTTAHAIVAQYQRANGQPLAETWQFIASSVAASSATLDFVFSTVANSSFAAYVLTMAQVQPATDATNLFLRVSEDGGSNFNNSSTAYVYSGTWVDNNDSTIGVATTAAASTIALVLQSNMGNAAGENLSGILKFFDPSNTIGRKRFLFETSHTRETGVSVWLNGHGTYVSTAAINAIRLQANTGNINYGRFALYGLRMQ